ncbi:C40 family peptidase [Nonomuraea rhodomycinica]|uniref:C40 family peptidase n=1 Tax=Nonomuraea rhodomycinica TaxID=1712872 RepID=A0A7Y6MG25_9ACTN|nr:C40 family peptidase [Nonomuraea rhodomycinica]NUW45286.1 C40 family peptidase [Nonomuraea rhodomycinica]
MSRFAMLAAVATAGIAIAAPAGVSLASTRPSTPLSPLSGTFQNASSSVPGSSQEDTSTARLTSPVVTLTGADVKAARVKKTPLPAWKRALKYALDKRGTPYVWGGASPAGYDCSGLMLRAYQHAGITLPRTAAQQYNAFSRKISWKNLKPGDLVFFHGLGHVGMISKPGYMVHSPHTGDVVKVERLSAWRRSSFVGAVRPDPKGVKAWAARKAAGEEPAPAMPIASIL